MPAPAISSLFRRLSRRVTMTAGLLLCLLSTVGCAVTVHPRVVTRVQRQPDWMSLLATSPGTVVTVRGQGFRRSGRFEVASDRDVTILANSTRMTFARIDVCEVKMQEHHVGRHAKSGALKGAASGLVLGSLITAQGANKRFLLHMTGAWALMGLIGGAIDGAVDPVEVILYRVC